MSATELIKKIEFTSEIIREMSLIPKVENLGNAKCTMELFIEDELKVPKDGIGYIEWIIEFVDEKGELTGDEDYAGIGLWWQNKRLTDYDGVFSLPSQAIELIRSVGITVPKDFA